MLDGSSTRDVLRAFEHGHALVFRQRLHLRALLLSIRGGHSSLAVLFQGHAQGPSSRLRAVFATQELSGVTADLVEGQRPSWRPHVSVDLFVRSFHGKMQDLRAFREAPRGRRPQNREELMHLLHSVALFWPVDTCFARPCALLKAFQGRFGDPGQAGDVFGRGLGRASRLGW